MREVVKSVMFIDCLARGVQLLGRILLCLVVFVLTIPMLTMLRRSNKHIVRDNLVRFDAFILAECLLHTRLATSQPSDGPIGHEASIVSR